MKFRFGRYLERTGGRPVFDAPVHQLRSQAKCEQDSFSRTSI